MVELCRDYWAYCKEYFTKEDGSTTSSLFRIKQALKPLKALYGRTAASEFGPNALRTIRGKWLEQGLARKTINDYTSDIRRVFKWGASHELVSASVYQALSTVEGLRAGRSAAKETSPVRPVPDVHIRAVKPFVSRQVWGLIRLQILSAARPGEVVKLRPIDLDTSGRVWTAVLEDHKTRYRGRERTFYFGPKAQAVLKEFIADRPLNVFLFSPIEAEHERHALASSSQTENQLSRHRKTERVVGDRYTTASYRRAVERACKKAVVPVWTPRLRHNAATEVRQEYGLEAAQVILGHSSAEVTQVYAERDRRLAIEVAEQRG